MRQGAPSASESERGSRSATTPAAPKGTPINAKIVWALCVVVLSGVAAVAWTVHVPAREGVVLNAGARAAALGSSPRASGASAAQIPGSASSALEPLATPRVAVTTSPSMPSPPFGAKAEDVSAVPIGAAAVTPGVSGVPASTWPATTTASNGVPPRSDMRYGINPASRR